MIEEIMATFMVYLGALLLGVIAGLRTCTALAAVSWAAVFGALHLGGSSLAFLGSPITAWILTSLIVIETVVDQWPGVPSRKTPMQFAGRIASGALCGAAFAMNRGAWELGVAAGVIGAIVGTLGGYDIRMRLARAFRRDRPAAVLEDAVAVAGAAIVVAVL